MKIKNRCPFLGLHVWEPQGFGSPEILLMIEILQDLTDQNPRNTGRIVYIPEGPSAQYSRTLVPNTIEGMVFGTTDLKSMGAWTLWIWDHVGFISSTILTVAPLTRRQRRPGLQRASERYPPAPAHRPHRDRDADMYLEVQGRF